MTWPCPGRIARWRGPAYVAIHSRNFHCVRRNWACQELSIRRSPPAAPGGRRGEGVLAAMMEVGSFVRADEVDDAGPHPVRRVELSGAILLKNLFPRAPVGGGQLPAVGEADHTTEKAGRFAGLAAGQPVDLQL